MRRCREKCIRSFPLWYLYIVGSKLISIKKIKTPLPSLVLLSQLRTIHQQKSISLASRRTPL